MYQSSNRIPPGSASGGAVRLVDGMAEERAHATRVPSMEVIDEVELQGVPVKRVEVVDAYAPRTFEEHRAYDKIQDLITSLEHDLRSTDSVAVEIAIRTGRALLDSSPAVRAWKSLMPTAMALYPLQCPHTSTLLDGTTAIDTFGRELFLYGLDARAIRSRGEVFKALLTQGDREVDSIISLACGAAVPECDAIASMRHTPRAVFVDIDKGVLGHVDTVVRQTGLTEKLSYKPVQANLLRDFMYARESHPEMPPASFAVVDALGIAEYFDDARLEVFLRKAYQLVKPGGRLIFSNMLDTHPALQFNRHIVEWPGIRPRSAEALVAVASKVAGANNTGMYIAEDSVYAVLELQRPERRNGHSLGRTALVG